MCSKDNKENQQKLMFIDIPHQKNVSARQWGTSQWREREKKSISVNRNYEKKMFNLYYTLKAQYDQGRWPCNHLGDTSFLMWIGMNYNKFLKLCYTHWKLLLNRNKLYNNN